jgi:hypothetical protein
VHGAAPQAWAALARPGLVRPETRRPSLIAALVKPPRPAREKAPAGPAQARRKPAGLSEAGFRREHGQLILQGQLGEPSINRVEQRALDRHDGIGPRLPCLLECSLERLSIEDLDGVEVDAEHLCSALTHDHGDQHSDEVSSRHGMSLRLLGPSVEASGLVSSPERAPCRTLGNDGRRPDPWLPIPADRLDAVGDVQQARSRVQAVRGEDTTAVWPRSVKVWSVHASRFERGTCRTRTIRPHGDGAGLASDDHTIAAPCPVRVEPP